MFILYGNHTGHEMPDKIATITRAIKQLNEQITTDVTTRNSTCNSTLALPHPLSCMAISIAIMSCIEMGIAMQY